MAAKPTYASPAKLKLPKSLGACADLYKDLRDQRLLVDKLAAEWKAQETAVQEHIINNLSKTKEGGAVGQRYKAIITEGSTYKINDEKKFYDYVKKNGAFDLLQRRLNDKAVADRVDALKGVAAKKGLPGLELFKFPKLSVTKK